jgi:hypothetical protein
MFRSVKGLRSTGLEADVYDVVITAGGFAKAGLAAIFFPFYTRLIVLREYGTGYVENSIGLLLSEACKKNNQSRNCVNDILRR